MKKAGFQYYKVETGRYSDVRIRKLKRNFGTKGIAVYDYLLALIYGDEGCFAVCNDDCVFNVAEYFSITESVVTEVVTYCAEIGLFDKGLFERDKVLTSRSIQERFADMCKASRRQGVDIPKKYLLITTEDMGKESDSLVSTTETSRNSSENYGGNEENSGVSAKNHEFCPISKVKESKEKADTKVSAEKKVETTESCGTDVPLSATADAPSNGTLFGGDFAPIENASEIDFDDILRFWNETTKGVYGRLTCIQNKRRQSTKARINEVGLEQFKQAIRNAAESEFLPDQTWFNYDWMICPNNFTRVLEGQYRYRNGRQKEERVAADTSRTTIGVGGGSDTPRKRVYD